MPFNTSDANESEGVRLQKVMAAAGVASRRVCEDMISQGRVKVNGKVVTELGTRINPDVDKVTVGGTPVQLDNSRVYLALNKPRGELVRWPMKMVARTYRSLSKATTGSSMLVD